MKKFLSLVLALVMTMSLVTVSAGAADFTDDSSITYKEAVDVMTALGVVGGYSDGSFNPNGTLTRGAAAKIICNLILGTTASEALVADAAPYSDVPTNNVFAGYIAYLAKENVIGGYADGTFRPAATLTGYAFMKMLLGVIGLDASIEGYTGDNWSIAVAKRALSKGVDLTDGLVGDFNGVKAVTREEACLYAFNAIKAGKFTYDTKSTIVVGDVSVSSTSDAEQDKVGTDFDGAYFEDVFTSLKGYEAEVTDDFGRPATTWKIKSTTIGTYAKAADLTYTEKVKGKTIYADLNKGTVDNDEITFFLNGEDVSSDSDEFVLTKSYDSKIGGQGTLTEVYFDENDDGDKEVVIVMIETYLAQVSGDYDEDDEVLDIEFVNDCEYDVDTELELDDFANLADFEDEDYVLVTIAHDDDEPYVYSIELAEKVTATVTKYTVESSVVADGTTYKYNATYEEGDGPDSYVIKDEYDLYLDTYGNVIYADGVEAEDNVVYVSEIAKDGKLTASKVVAAALFLDGSYQEITLNKVDTTKAKDLTFTEEDDYEGWYTYKEKADGKYDLTSLGGEELDETENTEVTAKDSSYVDGIRATSKTKFVVTDAVDESGKAYTGIKSMPAITNKGDESEKAEIAVVMDGNYAKYVLIVMNDAKDKSTASSSDLVYILESEPTDVTVNEDEDTIYTYDAIVNGKVTTVDVHEDVDNADELEIGLYEDIVYTDDVITDLEKVEADEDTFVDCEEYTIVSYADADLTRKGTTVTFADEDSDSENGDAYALATNAKIMVIVVDEDGEYDEVKVVTAKKLVSDYDKLTAVVTGVIEDGEFTFVFVDLHEAT